MAEWESEPPSITSFIFWGMVCIVLIANNVPVGLFFTFLCIHNTGWMEGGPWFKEDDD